MGLEVSKRDSSKQIQRQNLCFRPIDSKVNIVKIPNTQRYRCLGNAVTTTVTQFIFENIICKCYI